MSGGRGYAGVQSWAAVCALGAAAVVSLLVYVFIIPRMRRGLPSIVAAKELEGAAVSPLPFLLLYSSLLLFSHDFVTTAKRKLDSSVKLYSSLSLDFVPTEQRKQ